MNYLNTGTDGVDPLPFINVSSSASSFTGVLDGYRSFSLPSQYKFGKLSYSTAYVIVEKQSLNLHVFNVFFSCTIYYRSAPMDSSVLGAHTLHISQEHSQLHSESLLHTGMIMTSGAKAPSDIFLLHQHIQHMQVYFMMLVTL